ncbi:MAG: type III-B CRISPR module RAMP protein Cmr1 [Chloroflexota bacterium]|nr:type III-B CRISPR module RAMP protein Cmr1 [Chloroflexota bacterium]
MMTQTGKVVFSVVATTATFMHGADPKNSAELRPPSIKGVMRYWFRALAGAYYPTNKLKEYEADIFGSTDTGAKLIVRIAERDNSVSFDNKYLLPHKPENRHKSPSDALLSGSQFDITLQNYPPSPTQSDLPEAASWALWTAINLGGFGQRARRGAGSLRLTQIAGLPEAPMVNQNYQNIKEVAQDIEQGLQRARAVIARLAGSPAKPLKLNDVADFPILDKTCAIIQVTKLTGRNEEEARAQLMKELHNYKNPAFGLPYMIPAAGDHSLNGRHASPLHLHLIPLASGFALVQTVLFSRFDIPVDQAKLEQYLDRVPSTERERISL